MSSIVLGIATSKAGRLLLGLLAVVAMCGAVYMKGRFDGAARLSERLAAERVTILKDGKEIDDATQILDDAGLCAVLGGC